MNNGFQGTNARSVPASPTSDNSRCQALDVDRSGAVRNYADGKVRWGEVWLDPNGRVHAIAISGEHFNTLIGGHQIPAAYFGGKE
jgi:hypothetical protein